MKYHGLSSERRKHLARILAIGKGAITINDAAKTLNWDREKARLFLSSLNRSGWLKLIKYGVYVPVPLEADEPGLTSENELVLSNYLFGKCYIGGWSAASFWGLTDQLFRKVWVLTTNFVRKKEEIKSGHTYLLQHISNDYFFGLHTEWIGQDKVHLSDPHKTVIDFANFIDAYGLQSLIDVLTSYLHSEHKNLNVLLDYAHKANNRTLFKRIVFMLEKLAPDEEMAIYHCLENISKGPSKLSPKLSCEIYISKWKLKVPQYMARQ